MMRTRTLIAAAILCALPLLADAASHRKIVYIDQYDQDLDGRVSSAEFELARRARFDITDTNRNGSVDAEEYVFEWEDRLDAQLAVDRKEQVKQTATRFASLDEDGNARITREEFDVSGTRSFSRFDSNQDGVIDTDDTDSMEDEVAASEREMTREQILANQQRMLEMPSTHSKAGTITQYDGDADEAVALAEFKAGRDANWNAMDENGDGGVSEDEYTAEFENRLDAQIAGSRKQSVEQANVRFGVLDADEDKVMTFREYQDSGHRTFARWDTDGDGYVTLEEAEPVPDEEIAREQVSASTR